jgi:hypothetical protein
VPLPADNIIRSAHRLARPLYDVCLPLLSTAPGRGKIIIQLFRLAYLTVTNAFAALRLLPLGDRDKDVEILALRHQITIFGAATRRRQMPEDVLSVALSGEEWRGGRRGELDRSGMGSGCSTAGRGGLALL